MPENHAVKNEAPRESFFASTIPMLFMIAVSVATYLVMDNFYREDSKPGVLIYSVADWIPVGRETTLTPEKVKEYINQSELAVKRAAKAGYIVLPSSAPKEIPDSNRLMPGMFPRTNKGEQ